MLDHDSAISNQRCQNCCARIYGEAGRVLRLFTSTQLIELIARKNHMKAVMLTVQKRNISAMNFYTRKLRYTISSISPSRVDPLIGAEKSYENFTRTLPSASYYFSNAVFEKMRHLSSTRSTRHLSSTRNYLQHAAPGSLFSTRIYLQSSTQAGSMQSFTVNGSHQKTQLQAEQ